MILSVLSVGELNLWPLTFNGVQKSAEQNGIHKLIDGRLNQYTSLYYMMSLMTTNYTIYFLFHFRPFFLSYICFPNKTIVFLRSQVNKMVWPCLIFRYKAVWVLIIKVTSTKKFFLPEVFCTLMSQWGGYLLDSVMVAEVTWSVCSTQCHMVCLLLAGSSVCWSLVMARKSPERV